MPLEGFTLLFDLGIILIAATLLSYAARLLKQPPLLAYIAAGIIIGPMLLGSLGIELGGIPLGVTTTQEIIVLSELGVAFLLFSVGLESELPKFKSLGKIAAIGTLLQVFLTALLVVLFHFVMNVLTFEQALYLGIIVAFSSTTIVVKLLSDSREVNTLHGRIMIGFLLMQDLIVIIALPVLSSIGKAATVEILAGLALQVVVLLGVALLMSKKIYPRLFEFASHSNELFFLSAMSSVFFFIFLSYIIGFPIAVGAFIAGVAMSSLPYSLDVSQNLRGIRDFLATVFFVTLGIQLSPSIASFPLGLALMIIAIVFILKPLVFYSITMLEGYGNKTSIVVALSLAQVSEFGFIIANRGLAVLGQTPGLYPFIILVISVSMAMTPYMMAWAPKLHELVVKSMPSVVCEIRKHRFFYRRIDRLDNAPIGLSGHIVVFGAGTVGSGVVDALSGEQNIVVVDSDPEVVTKLLKKGINAVCGSAENPEVWEKAGVLKAKLIVLAIPYNGLSLRLVRHAKKAGKHIGVFGRAHYFRNALSLYDAGADLVVMPQVVGSNLFVHRISDYLRFGKVDEMGGYKDLFVKFLKEKSREERKRVED